VIWGIDLGVRTAHLAAFDGDELVHLVSVGYEKKQPHRSMELAGLQAQVQEYVAPEDDVWVEKPPLAGPRNLATFGDLNQTYGAVLAAAGGREAIVPVWKRDVCGNGRMTKAEVSRWLKDHHRPYSDRCGGDQNLVDAVCIALYGKVVEARAKTL
jgi:hypothetical protein